MILSLFLRLGARPNPTAMSAAPPPLRRGDRVTIFGLKRRSDLNGTQGTLSYPSASRWTVLLDDEGEGEPVSVGESNLVHAADYDTDDEYNASRASKRPRSAEAPGPSQAQRPSLTAEGGEPGGILMLPDPPPPPPEVLLAKQKAHDARETARGPHHRRSRMAGWGQREHNALVHGCSLAEPYDAKRDDARLAADEWVATEKYDGCRAVWDPGHADGPGFRTRSGSHFKPPPCFAALLPGDMQLDGELWAGRRNFASVGMLMGSRSLGSDLHARAWQCLTFVVFDAPRAEGGYLQRLGSARARLARTHESERVVVAPTATVADAAAKDALLRRVVGCGGEGLVLRQASAFWRAGRGGAGDGRDPALLKVKMWLDAEAEVLESRPAPTASNLPTLRCRALNAPNADTSEAASFEISVPRDFAPPPAGSIVTFRYRQISQVSGQPTVAGGGPQLGRVHDSATCDCCFCSASRAGPSQASL